eukprot:31398-Pelagococcus_subviridis.AAC.5
MMCAREAPSAPIGDGGVSTIAAGLYPSPPPPSSMSVEVRPPLPLPLPLIVTREDAREPRGPG